MAHVPVVARLACDLACLSRKPAGLCRERVGELRPILLGTLCLHLPAMHTAARQRDPTDRIVEEVGESGELSRRAFEPGSHRRHT